MYSMNTAATFAGAVIWLDVLVCSLYCANWTWINIANFSKPELEPLILDCALLEALLAVSRLGSFDRAARNLNVAPSAVSQHIKLLEERVGAVLVHRG